MPLGKYKTFSSCKGAAKRKGIKKPGAYCATIEHNITGYWPSEKRGKRKKKK